MKATKPNKNLAKSIGGVAVLIATWAISSAAVPPEAGRREIPLSGSGWTADGVPVSVPHTWNAEDGADGKGASCHASSCALSYTRKPVTYRRPLPSPRCGKRYFVKCEGVSILATVRVNGTEAGRHNGAFTAFCLDVTDLLKPDGNILEIVADNRVDPDVPPVAADFTMFGGIYRDVVLLETDPVHFDCETDGASGVWVVPDATDGTVKVRARVTGGSSPELSFRVSGPGLERPVVSTNAVFAVPGYRLWSPETPNLYVLEATVREGHSLDRVTVSFGFRTCEFRDGAFFLNGRRRQMHGVNYHQDRKGKGWAISRDDIREDVALIKDLGCDAIRTAHYPHSQYAYDRCDAEGLLAWIEAPNVNRIRATPAYRENALTLVREMVAQYRNHPCIFAWSTSNEINFDDQDQEAAEALMRELSDVVRRTDPTRPVATATCRSHQVRFNAIPDVIGFNFYPGWYRSTPDGMRATTDGVFAENPSLRSIGVTEYGAGASVFQHADVFERPKPSSAWHPEEWQAWVHSRNYLGLVDDPRVWGAFVWLMFDFAADVTQEGDPFGLNDKGLMTYDHREKKDAYWFYRANWKPGERILHLVGEASRTGTNAVANVLAFSTVGPVRLSVNGVDCGVREPDRVKSVCWKDVALRRGGNRIRIVASGLERETVWTVAD